LKKLRVKKKDNKKGIKAEESDRNPSKAPRLAEKITNEFTSG
jgi:hypothetical protein